MSSDSSDRAVFNPLEVESYHKDGYMLPGIQVFEEKELDHLTEIFERLSSEGKNLDTVHFRNEELLPYLLDDRVLDIIEPLIGPDIGLWSSHFISKEPGTGKATPWHEDSTYWDGRFDSFNGIVTMWLALDPSSTENGCMRVIPGSHLQEDFEYEDCSSEDNIFITQIKGIDESVAVDCVLNRGEFSLHDSRIVHGAKKNTGSQRRCGYTMRYFSQNMKLNTDHPGNKNFKLWHARGENPHGNPVVNN